MKAFGLDRLFVSLEKDGPLVPPLPIDGSPESVPGVGVIQNRAARPQFLYFTDFP